MMSKKNTSADYRGPERRRHQMFVTRNTEYHFRDDVCVAVRSRCDGNWRLDHDALQRPLSGAVRFNRNGDAYPTLSRPTVGDALFFGTDGRDVVTSVLTAIQRPIKKLVAAYPV